MSLALPLLAATPLLTAAAVASAPPGAAPALARAGALVTFVLAGGVLLLVARGSGAGLAEAEEAALERALEAEEVREPALRAALRESLRAGPDPAEPDAVLADAVGLPDLLGALRQSPPGSAEAAALAERVAAARALRLELSQRRQRLARALEPARRAAARHGAALRLVTLRPWLPPLGAQLLLGLDLRGAALTAVAALLALQALLLAELPPARLVALLTLEAGLLLTLAARDGLLHASVWTLALLPEALLAPGARRAALGGFALAGLGALALLVAATAAAPGVVAATGGPPAWAGALLALGCAARLAPALLSAGAVAWDGAAAFALVAAFLCAGDGLLRDHVPQVALLGLAGGALVGGVLLAWRARGAAELLAAEALAGVGLVALARGAGGELGHAAAGLAPLGLSVALGLGALGVAALAARGGDLAGCAAPAPALHGLAVLGLASAAGLPGLAGFPPWLLGTSAALQGSSCAPGWAALAAGAPLLLLGAVARLLWRSPGVAPDGASLTPAEGRALVPVAALSLALGLGPGLLLGEGAP